MKRENAKKGYKQTNQKSEIKKKTTKEFCIDLYNSEGIDGEKFYKLLKEIEYDLHRGSCQKKLIDFIGLSRQQGYEEGKKEQIMAINAKVIENAKESKEFAELIEEMKEKEYEKGFIAGADATGSQMNELKIEEIKEIEKRTRQQFAEEILESLPKGQKTLCDCIIHPCPHIPVGAIYFNKCLSQIKQIIKNKLTK